MPQDVWAHAIEEVFDEKASDAPLTWPWTAETCSCCMGILQDYGVAVTALPLDGYGTKEGRGKKRKHPVSATIGADSVADVAELPVDTPHSRPPPVILYPSIFPHLCDAVLSKIKSM